MPASDPHSSYSLFYKISIILSPKQFQLFLNFQLLLRTILTSLITSTTTVIFMFYNFFSALAMLRCLSILLPSSYSYSVFCQDKKIFYLLGSLPKYQVWFSDLFFNVQIFRKLLLL